MKVDHYPRLQDRKDAKEYVVNVTSNLRNVAAIHKEDIVLAKSGELGVGNILYATLDDSHTPHVTLGH